MFMEVQVMSSTEISLIPHKQLQVPSKMASDECGMLHVTCITYALIHANGFGRWCDHKTTTKKKTVALTEHWASLSMFIKKTKLNPI